MKYKINTELTQQLAVKMRRREMVSLCIGYAGMCTAGMGLMGALALQFIDTNIIPTSCLMVMGIGLCLFGLGKILFPKQPMALAFLAAEKDGKILEVSCVPKSTEPDYALITILIETPSGKCEHREIGYARTCIHTGYTEQTLDLNDECIYCPYQPTPT